MPAEPRPFPWAEAMEFGLGVLKLPPEAFWQMTLPELAAAVRGALGASGREPPPRAALQALMRQFPDIETNPIGELSHERL